MGPNLWTRNSPYVAKMPCLGNNNKVIGVVSRRPTNLGDMILKRKRFALKAESPWPKRCYPLFNNIRAKKKGIPCHACPMMSEFEIITSSATGKTFNLPEANCKSRNIVWCDQCYFCNKQYTGKSSNKLQIIIVRHRSHVGYSDDNVINESDEKTLSEHLQEVHNFVSIYQFNSNYSLVKTGS